jgi:D-inositol-3-phosphate glycosyltransferase
MKQPKSILLLSDFAYPVKAGTERLVFGVAQWFTKEYGIQVDILTPNWNHQSEIEKVDGVTIYRFDTHDIEDAKPFKRIKDYIQAGRKLPKYDIYHGFYMVPVAMATVALAKLKRAKSVNTFFSTEQLEKNFTNGIKKALIKIVIRKSDFLTVYTWNIEKVFKENYFPHKPVTVTQGWVDTEFSKRDPRKKPAKKYIVFAGRWEESKGIFVLLEAFSKIRENTNAELVLIGSPFQKEKVEKEIDRLEIAPYVKPLGFVTVEEMVEWYQKAWVVTVPALHGDAFGFSLMEAMYYGTPVVTTDGVGLQDLEYEGMVVKKGSVDELTRVLLKMLSNEDYYKKCVEKVGQLVSVFDKKKVMEKYLNVYETVLS